MEKNIFKKLPIEMTNDFRGVLKYNISKEKSYRNPFFSLKNEKETISSFVDAINSNKFDVALSFVSRRVNNIDIDELKEIFSNKSICKCMAVFKSDNNDSKGFISVALKDCKNKNAEIVHVRMIREPGKLSQWKIFEIIRE